MVGTYRIRCNGHKYKIQKKGWIFWNDMGKLRFHGSRNPFSIETTYFKTKLEADIGLNEIINQDLKEEAKWVTVIDHGDVY